MISLVAAMTRSKVIGNDDKLPWHIPKEMQRYKKLVAGGTVILGRKTFESMKNIPGKHAILISRSIESVKGAEVCKSISEALKKARSYADADVFIIGGASIFEHTIGIADRMYLSYIKKEYAGNKFFPSFDLSEWELESREDFPEFEYVVYSRIKRA
ncbi:MAG: dihydrofolate reductase [Nitrososphaeria archaeon]